MGVFESMLNNTFDIYRLTRTDDGQGGWTEGHAYHDTVRGRLRPASGTEREQAAQVQRELTHVFYVLATEDIQRGDLVDGDGVTVEVLGVREPSRADHHLEIDCQETQLEVTI